MANANEQDQGSSKSGAQGKGENTPTPPFAEHFNELRHRQFHVHLTDGRVVPVGGDDAYAMMKAINEGQVAYEILELSANRTPVDGAIIYLTHVTSVELQPV
jgi:hypothetical protein